MNLNSHQARQLWKQKHIIHDIIYLLSLSQVGSFEPVL